MATNLEIYQASLTNEYWRPSNEDVEIVNMNLRPNGTAINPDFSPVNVFIICDGHGGKKVSKAIAPYIAKKLLQKGHLFPLSMGIINKLYDGIQKKLENSEKKIADGCGSTALVAIIYQINRIRYVQVINIGDCRIVVSKNGVAVAWSKDHKPDWPDEKRRITEIIKKTGSREKIYFGEEAWRIGDLSVSRSFGDVDNLPFVTHHPDVFNHKLTTKCKFMILACDGLWDVLTNEEAINFVEDHRTDNLLYTYQIPDYYLPYRKGFISYKVGYHPSYQANHNIAEKLAQYAIARGSTDNVSIIIIFFN